MTVRRKSDSEPVAVAEAPNPIIAAAWQEILINEGIPASVSSDDALAVAYLVSSPYSCRLLVPADDAARARDILASFLEDVPEVEES